MKFSAVHIDCILSFDDEFKKINTKKNGRLHKDCLLHQNKFQKKIDRFN